MGEETKRIGKRKWYWYSFLVGNWMVVILKVMSMEDKLQSGAHSSLGDWAQMIMKSSNKQS